MEHDHISRAYQSELDHLRQQLLEMGGLAEQQLTLARASSATLQAPTESQINVLESAINLAQVNIDAECTRIIAKRQPTANDLRQVIATLRAVSDLERIGDEAKNIMHRVSGLKDADQIGGNWQPQLLSMIGHVQAMLSEVLTAFSRLDAKSAHDVMRRDATVDSEYAALTLTLEALMIAQVAHIHNGVSIVLIAKAVERCGDHAKNLAECVISVVHGDDVRHRTVTPS